jgi:arylsulfatase A-like enzyme
MKRPNILLILIDDMGWRDLSCYGSPFYETPHIDRLAAEGMSFNQAYAACPVCSPTRASLLTGKYPARLGVTDWIDWGFGIHPARGKLIDAPYVNHLPLQEKTIARALGEGGYQTWHIGKWHLGGEAYFPEKHGFEINIGGCEWGSPHNGYFSPWGIPRLSDEPPGKYLGDHLTDKAIQLIEDRDERPFFLNLWYYDVHTPIQAKLEKILKYEQKARDLHLDELQTFSEGAIFPVQHKKDKRILRRLVQSDANYAGMIESLDENIGRLLSTLEQEGIAQDTLVIFTSDNGGLSTAEGSPTTNAPLSEGKGWMYEGGTREPLIIIWPGHTLPGSLCHTPVISPDFYPTLLEIAGLPLDPEQHCDGTSLVPLLLQNGLTEPRPIFWHYPHYGNQGGTPGSSVRIDDYKLIEFFEDNRLELYNLRHDLGEQINLAKDEPQQLRLMHQVLVEWREKVQAKIPKPNSIWQINTI